jgi:hypothetical protein
MGKMFFNILATFAEFSVISTCYGCAPVKAWPSPEPKAGYAAGN